MSSWRAWEATQGLTRFGLGSIELQEMQAEQPVLVGPNVRRTPAGVFRQRLKPIHRIFVRILGVNALGPSEPKLAAQHPYCLAREAHEMHLDAATRLVIDCVVGEAADVDVAVEL